MADTFHFLQPLWLLALLPLMLLLWLLHRREGGENPWRKIVDAALLPLLLTEGKGGAGRLPWWLLAIGWLVAVLALANPSWDRRPQPVFQSGHARVIVLDLSRSMDAADLKPSRLTRARFKVADILARHKQGLTEGRNALVVFAGDAFAVAPLTRDAETVTALLKPLDPGIMPAQGSRVDLGLIKAGELLRQAGAARGEVLLLTDGYKSNDTGRETLDAARDLRRQGHTVSVLGVGTVEGAPVPLGGGGFLRDAEGNVVVPKLDPEALRALANAGGGAYAAIHENDSDLDALTQSGARMQDAGAEAAGLESETWIERGPWLVILLLPLAALAFRRGWLLAVLLLAGGVLPPQKAMAFAWQDLWQRHDQQAATALEAGEPARAAELASNPLRRGAARYRSGDYQGALEDFNKADGANAAYNRGNALARLGEYPKAIDAYDQALELAPDMEDARANKAAVEKLLQQQQEQQQDSSSKGQQPEEKQQAENQSGEGAGQEEGGEAGSGQRQNGQEAQPDKEEGGSSDKQDAQSTDGKPGADRGERGSEEQKGGPGKQQEPSGDNQFAQAAEAQNEEEERTKQAGVVEPEPELEPKSWSESETEQGIAGTDADEAGEKQGQLEARGEEGDQETDDPANSGVAAAEELTSEEQMAAEQWLRRIPDDPGGLLRRKFLYQYRQRPTQPGSGSEQPW